jgi:hypothetical protein
MRLIAARAAQEPSMQQTLQRIAHTLSNTPNPPFQTPDTP